METVLLSKYLSAKVVIKKSYQLASGSEFYTISSDAANRQFDWLEIYLVSDKNDQHNTIFNSYNVELASTILGKVKAENFTHMHSVASDLEFDLTDKDQKHQICKQFVAYNCIGCLKAPLTDYAHNKIFQELATEEKHFSTADARMDIKVRDRKGYTSELGKVKRSGCNLVLHLLAKTATTKKMRLQIFRKLVRVMTLHYQR